MKIYVTGSSFNPEDNIFTAALGRYFANRNYGEGLKEIVLRLDVVDISNYSGSLAQSPVFANGKVEYESTITIGDYYEVVTPSEYVNYVLSGLEKLEWVLPKGVDFATRSFLAEATQFVAEYKGRAQPP